MKKVLALVLAVVMLSGVGMAQEGMMIGAGSKALLFKFGGLSTLSATAYIPNGIGLQYFMSSDMALRGSLIFGTKSTTIPFNPTPGTTQTGKDGTSSSTTFGVAGDILMYNWGHKTVSPYMGAGLMFTTTSTETKPVTTDPTVQGTDKNNKADGAMTEFSLGLITGVEYFLAKEVSIGAEYRLGFASTSYPDRAQSGAGVSVTTKQGSSTSIGFSTVSLNLAVYM